MSDPATTIREALERLHIGHRNERLPEEPPCPYCERRAAALAALTELEQQLADAYDRESGTSDALDSMRADREVWKRENESYLARAEAAERERDQLAAYVKQLEERLARD